MQPVTIGNYSLLQLIGSGSFATVWLGEHKITGNKVAVKVISKTNMNSPQSITRFNREISLLKQLDHPFIAQLFDVIEDDEAYYLFMEYVDNCSLFTKVNIEGRLTENAARRYFCQLISALNYLHNEKFIVHRDLKPENILLDKYDNIRLIDFGLSNQFSKSSPNLNTACGSPAYAAPEMIQGYPYTKSADIWSAGVILYAMVAGTLPFDDQNVQILLQKVVYTNQTYPASMSRSLVDLLKRLLSKDPKKRLTISQIINHPWLAQSGYASIIDNHFFSPNTNMNIISPSISMPLLSQQDLAFSSFDSLPTNTTSFNNNFEMQNSVSYDLLPVDSNLPLNADDLQQNNQIQLINQSQSFNNISHPLIDQSIVIRMISFGINVSSLTQHIMMNEYNDITSIYRQIKKEKTSFSVSCIMNNISNSHDKSNSSVLSPQMQAPAMMPLPKTSTIRRSSYPTPGANINEKKLPRPVVMKRPRKMETGMPTIPTKPYFTKTNLQKSLVI